MRRKIKPSKVPIFRDDVLDVVDALRKRADMLEEFTNTQLPESNKAYYEWLPEGMDEYTDYTKVVKFTGMFMPRPQKKWNQGINQKRTHKIEIMIEPDVAKQIQKLLQFELNISIEELAYWAIRYINSRPEWQSYKQYYWNIQTQKTFLAKKADAQKKLEALYAKKKKKEVARLQRLQKNPLDDVKTGKSDTGIISWMNLTDLNNE
jgi:hypothetical protein